MIIGRTHLTAEKRSNKQFLTREKYYYISHLVRDFIIKNCITELPVRLNNIIKNNKWKIVTYSSLRKLNNSEYNVAMSENLGFTISTFADYYICYDETEDLAKQRFTIAHEIGHIVLGHFYLPMDNQEQEASMFAARLLMPMCVLYECNVRSANEIKELCFVSNVSAQYRWVRLEMLTNRKKIYTDRNEIEVYKAFKAFIAKYNANKK